ncbi:MAG TPA: 30S ribosomal protein S16 [Cyclobacteriaceae bacterium]|nr:30S ribosomal protein S16 [Cyclobacteriaceae bacterium]
MAVKIRLARRGRKKLAMYDIIIAQSRSPRDGVSIEKIGTYNPLTNPASININAERALDWLMKGAQPTESVRAMLSYKGIMLRKHLQVGVQKGAVTQEEADKRFDSWKSVKDSKINSKIDRVSADKEAGKKARMEREVKVNEARTASLRERLAAKAREQEKAETPQAPVQAAEPVTEEINTPPAVEATEAPEKSVAETPEITEIPSTPEVPSQPDEGEEETKTE